MKFGTFNNQHAVLNFTLTFDRPKYSQGLSDGGGGVNRYLYPQKSAQVNFSRGKNDVRTAIQQTFIPPKQISGSGYAPEYSLPKNVHSSLGL